MQIKDEFRKLIPPLSVEEFKQLEVNCLADGIRDAILTWNGFIIDGHNRYEIAQKHGLTFKTESKEFESEDDVIIWMCNNQLGRRNLPIFVRYELTQQIKEALTRKGKLTQGTRTDLLSIIDKKLPEHNTQKVIAEKLDKSTGWVGMADVVSKKAPQEVKEKLRSGEVSVNQAYEEIKKEEKKAEIQQRRDDIKEGLVLHELKPTGKKYRIIYADPPWKYGNAMPEYVTEPQDYYTLMTTEDICNMPVKQITEDNAVLFMWSTSPHLPEALQVVKDWGFTYKTTFIWDKIKHNMGHYNSVRHEILLVCTKGACTPDVKKLFDSVQSIERTEHSKKPEQFREIIETIYTYGNKIELFARQAPNGWDVFGNQIAP